MPLVVILHGNYDRPQWECDTWHRAVGDLAFLLCPRGVPSPWGTPAKDRWSYTTHKTLKLEVLAAIAALERAYPGKVTRKNMMLAGFSLGAILAPTLFEATPKLFSTLFLVEGGVEKLSRGELAALKLGGLRGIAFAMGSFVGSRQVTERLPYIRYLKLPVHFIDMKGAGHGYGPPFSREARRIVKEFLSLKAR